MQSLVCDDIILQAELDMVRLFGPTPTQKSCFWDAKTTSDDNIQC